MAKLHAENFMSRNFYPSWTSSIFGGLILFLAGRSSAQVAAFPGALGFAANATGGRAGSVYHVTTLADSGAGSFRDAVSKSGRIIVFAVGGYINLSSAISVKDNLTIGGQTAPGGGIAVLGREVSFNNAENVIVRHFRFRQGDFDPDNQKSGINLLTATNIMLDHISIEFAHWNGIDAVTADQITVQNSILADHVATKSFHNRADAEQFRAVRRDETRECARKFS